MWIFGTSLVNTEAVQIFYDVGHLNIKPNCSLLKVNADITCAPANCT